MVNAALRTLASPVVEFPPSRANNFHHRDTQRYADAELTFKSSLNSNFTNTGYAQILVETNSNIPSPCVLLKINFLFFWEDFLGNLLEAQEIDI